MKYEIVVQKVEYRSVCVKVEADSKEEAEIFALEKAKVDNLHWGEIDYADEQILHVEKCL
jgi:hypothetical protein